MSQQSTSIIAFDFATTLTLNSLLHYKYSYITSTLRHANTASPFSALFGIECVQAGVAKPADSMVFKVGEQVWAHTGSEATFDRGTVEALLPAKGTVSVRLKSGTVDVKEADVHRMNAASQDGVPDNTYLRELNEATLLHNVRTRYNSEKDDGGCYSVTGHILIAVNPFRKLGIYEESNVRARARHACARWTARSLGVAASVPLRTRPWRCVHRPGRGRCALSLSVPQPGGRSGGAPTPPVTARRTQK